MAESVYENLSQVVFHFTTVDSLANMLANDTMAASIASGTASDRDNNAGVPYFVSFSTSGNGNIGFARSVSKSMGKVTLVFNGRMLSNLGKSSPVDYWRIDKRNKSIDDITRYDEHEERLFLSYPEIINVSKYLLSIHVYVGELTDSNKKDLHMAWGLSLNRSIPFYTYENETYYNHRYSDGAYIEDEHYDGELLDRYTNQPVEAMDRYDRGLENWLVLWMWWDTNRLGVLLDFMRSSKGVKSYIDQYDFLGMNKFLNMVRGWAEEDMSNYSFYINYDPNGMTGRDFVNSRMNDLHNAKKSMKFATMRYLVHTIITDINSKAGGDIQLYIRKSFAVMRKNRGEEYDTTLI